MPPRRRPQFTQENIDQQLQQIHLLDPASSSENLEQLGPIIRQIHANRQQEAYLRTVQALIDSKDAEIEKICSENYQDFISSVSTLFTVKSYTDKMKESIASLDDSVAKIGGGLVEKKRALLQTKKTAANMDEAIDTLQACLRVLDVVDRVGEMVKAGRYWSALRAQSDLILPTPLRLASLPALTQEISGFFIVESHVLETTGTFRSQKDVEELWDALVGRLSNAIEEALQREQDPEAFLRVKESLLSFIMTLEKFILVLFEKYASLLESQFSKRFEMIVRQDDHTPMQAETTTDVTTVLDTIWLQESEKKEISAAPTPQLLPWSQSFFLCCQDIRLFIQKFYAFVEGVSGHHRDIDEILSKSLDNLLIKHISEAIGQRLVGTSTLTQIAQIITNLEHFQAACSELQRSLTNLRSSQRGGIIRLNASSSFQTTLSRSLGRIAGLISSKLDQFFELSEYDWTPKNRETSPSMYLYELVNWLTTVVDSLVIKESYKDEAYKGALTYIADCLMNFLGGRDIPMLNENAISNILIDVDFLEDELKRIGRGHLASVFTELRLTASIPLNNTVQEYLVSGNRQSSYAAVKAKRLQALLDKLGKYGSQLRDSASREQGEKRRKEADAVGRIFPGDNR
ncbi:hypothetical protein H1R20_g5533, partial [Candolleomyces eurysporus]